MTLCHGDDTLESVGYEMVAIIISYPTSASGIIVKYYMHMDGGAGRTLKQVAHVTQDKASHLISRLQEVGRRIENSSRF